MSKNKFNFPNTRKCKHLGHVQKIRSACQGGNTYQCNKLDKEVSINRCKDYPGCSGDWNDSPLKPCEFYEPAEKVQKLIVATKTIGPVDLKAVFDGVYLVNLQKRPDRLNQCMNELANGWPFDAPKRILAVDGHEKTIPENWESGPGAYGCLLSHRNVLEEAIRDGKKQILVLEDDFSLVPNFAEKVQEFLANVPDDWDGIWLGGEHRVSPWKTSSENVVRCIRTHRTHAYALRGSAINKVLKFWKGDLPRHLDVQLGRAMPAFKFYAPRSFLIRQRESKSDIEWPWYSGDKLTPISQLEVSGELKIPQILHRIWVGGKPIPEQFEKYWQGWKENHPNWATITWRDADIPLFGKKCIELCKQARNPAEMSDVLRYHIVDKFGGVYIDTDFECLHPIGKAIMGHEFVTCREDKNVIACGFFGATAGHPILKELIQGISIDHSKSQIDTGGPGFFTKILKNGNRPGIKVHPIQRFYPYPYAGKFEGKGNYPWAFAAHHWAHSWK